MNEQEKWAWAAGLFEGEGSIYLGAKGQGRRLALGMNDRDVVERFQGIVSAGYIAEVKRPEVTAKTYYEWQLGAWLETKRILETMLPYFGERRTTRALEFLANPPKGDNYKKDICKRGHPLSGENLRLNGPTPSRPSGRRRCRACERLYDVERRARRANDL